MRDCVGIAVFWSGRTRRTLRHNRVHRRPSSISRFCEGFEDCPHLKSLGCCWTSMRFWLWFAITKVDGAEMIPDLDIDVLRVVLTIAETGRFTSAARLLNRTQAAVSAQVKRLEDQIGVRVFDREPRGARLTREGEQFIRYAREIVAINETAVGHFLKRRPPEQIRIGVPEGYAVPFLSDAIATMSRDALDAHLDVKCDHSPALLQRLDSGELDLVVATRQPDRQDGYVVTEAPLVWVSSQAFTQPVDKPVPLALYPPGICVHRSVALDTLAAHQVAWNITLTSSHLESLLVPVMAGRALTVLTRFALRDGLLEFPHNAGLPLLPSSAIVLHSAKSLGSSAARLKDILLSNGHAS